ncbi:MAG: hypothetical protein AAF212_01130 [Verrucomicrobiota bacterium]
MANWIDKLERKIGGLAVPNLTFTLLMAQVVTVGLSLMRQISPQDMVLNIPMVFNGEWWRLVTFMVLPRITPETVSILSIIFTGFALYIFYLMGSTLEGVWSHFKFNLFVFLGWFLTVLLSFFAPGGFMTNTSLIMALFLAFARYNGEMQFLIFFVIPVKVKWLAWLNWGIFAYVLIAGPSFQKLEVLAAVALLGLFFGRDVFGEVKAQARSNQWKKKRAAEAEVPMHTCVICGRTNISHPDLAFRYDGGYAFCEDHIHMSEEFLAQKRNELEAETEEST